MERENKIKLLKEITGKGLEYWQDSYVEEFYKNYMFVSDIKEMFGADAITKLYDLVNSELFEFMRLLSYLEEE